MGKTILVAEDDKDLLNIYSEILEFNGYKVKTAVNGKEAVSKYKESFPTLVIMDGDMPDVDGFEAFFEIKKTDENAKVVIVTGYSDLDKKCKQALEKGLISVISKPIGLDTLLDLAKKFCNEITVKK